MATQASSKRYFAFSVQSAKGTPASSPSLFIPVVTASSRAKWSQNLQQEKYAQGDKFLLVDGIPVKPSASLTVVCPFKPSVLNSLLAACCYANGDLIDPVWCTWFIGDGSTEKIFTDVLFTDGKMDVDDSSGPALWTLNMLGLNIPTNHTVRTRTLPAYERSFRMSNMMPNTYFANANVKNIEKMTWNVTAGVTAYFGSRGDGTDGPSDLISNELGATMDVTKAYEDDVVDAAYLNACGLPGVFTAVLTTACGTAHTHSFSLPNGLVADEEIMAPDDLPLDQGFTVWGLRATSGTGSPAAILIDPT